MRLRGAIAVAAMAAPAVAVLLAIPPWMVVDADDPGRRHAALGHHPLWQRPTPELADEVLRRTEKPPRGGARPSLQIRVNRVRLAGEMAGATVAGACLAGALARRRSQSRGAR